MAGLVLASLGILLDGCGGGRQSPAAFEPSWSPDGRSIAFVVDPDPSAGCPYGSCVSRFQVWLMRSGGTGARKLVRGDTAAWAPDGRTLAVVRDGYIYRVSRDGTRMRRLSGKTYEDRDPTWSPDGKQIAFVRYVRLPAKAFLDAKATLWVMNADGSGERQLTSRKPDFVHGHSWSPDGSRIALTGFEAVYTIGADGRGLKMLYRGEGVGSELAWSPDGGRIAVLDRYRTLAVVDMQGRVRRLANVYEEGGYPEPDWSPDGRRLAFSSGAGIEVVDADGTNRSALATESGDEWRPRWSPDGRLIAFDDGGDVYLVNADGTGRRKISNLARAED